VATAAHNLIADLSTPGTPGPPVADYVEPSLLQAVCWQLWEKLPPGVTEISDWAIREYSDAGSALAIRCGQVIGEVAALYDISSKELRAWLLNHFITDSGTRGGTHEGTRTTAGLPNAVPRLLLDRHVLTSQMDESVRYYRLLSRRLVEPLWKASVDRPAAPSVAEYLRAVERAPNDLGLQTQLALALAGDKALARERAREATDATDPPLSQAHKQLAMQLAGHRVGLSRPYPGAPERRRR
jgi:hypothetical protein